MFKYTLKFFNQLSINMSEASKLLFTVDKNVTEKEQPIYHIYKEWHDLIYSVCGRLSQSVQIRGFRAQNVHIEVFVLIDKE